jgi:hypothetical protein
MKKRIFLLPKPAFLSVSFTVVLLAFLALEATYDWFSGSHNDLSDPMSDAQIHAQDLLQNSNKEIFFIENLGQIKDTEGEERPDILFHTRSEGVDMYIRKSGVTYVFRTDGSTVDEPLLSSLSKSETSRIGSKLYRLDMEFDGMNDDIILRKELNVEQKFNYYAPGHTEGIFPKGYMKVTIENLYEGIDLVYYEKEGRMKYDFILKSGADERKIQMKYKGAESIYIGKAGDVVITTPMGEIREEKPYTYSEGTGVEIESRYRVKNNTVLFEVAEHEKNESIIIDPVRVWATYYGGGMGELSRSVCTDNSGNFYVTGRTYSTDFPTQTLAGAYNQSTYGGGTPDAFIL